MAPDCQDTTFLSISELPIFPFFVFVVREEKPDIAVMCYAENGYAARLCVAKTLGVDIQALECERFDQDEKQLTGNPFIECKKATIEGAAQHVDYRYRCTLVTLIAAVKILQASRKISTTRH